MGFFTKDISSMDDLFIHTLRDIYYAENQIVGALPDMVKKATEPALKAGFEKHIEETKGQIRRLDEAFQLLGVDATGVECQAIDGILAEAREIAGDIDDKSVMDAALIAAAQAVEHYEITRYGTLIAWADRLGREDLASLFEETLSEEKATDEQLSTLAEETVNKRAA